MAQCASMLNDNAFAWLTDRCTETHWFQATLFIKQNKLRKLATSPPPRQLALRPRSVGDVLLFSIGAKMNNACPHHAGCFSH